MKWSVGQSVVCGTRTEPKYIKNAENVELEKALFLWFTQMSNTHAEVTAYSVEFTVCVALS